MKILTLNTQKAYQSGFRDFFIRILGEEKYDFILLQEATAPIITLAKNAGLSYDILNPYDPELGENTHECILYKKEFQLIETLFISFSFFDKTHPHRGWGFVAGVFEKNGEKKLIGSMHLHPGFKKSRRMEQIRIIKERILEKNYNFPVIFGGDCNFGWPGEISQAGKILSPQFMRVTKGLGPTLDSRYTEQVPFGVARIANFLARFGISVKLGADQAYVDRQTTKRSKIKSHLLPDRVSDHLAIQIEIIALKF
ncbi:MAG: hypothetical protein V4665_01780 [Patescibacteria group bacterium]